ncbi:MAG: long-chain fatty acid--CoA ligase [Acidobacteria bacterium]|jgi:long-chain acyl-CoA synthetase|nr:MAG: long-chain fatty acid--CoA ligase [Acidobacteriota bacterium]GIU81830.1 MAG: AMP-dependent synthetase [Pyrinomonadaceae bacterium]
MFGENIAGFEKLPQTVPHFLMESFRRNKNRELLHHKVDGGWIRLTGKQASEKVKNITLGLKELGVEKGEKIAIISENRPEWSLADLAILSLGAVNVPIFTTQAVDQIRYILENSRAKMLFISNKKLFQYAKPAIESVESLEKLIFFDELEEKSEKITSFRALEEIGERVRKKKSDAYENLLENIKTEDLATIIYTSGTTGEPKGVMLTHKNFTSNILAVSRGLPIEKTDRSLAVLPLSHIFERCVFYILCSNGVAVHYCSSYDQLASLIAEVKPTVMTAVPRLFEQVYHKIVKKGMSAGGWKTKLFVWALEIGQQYWKAKEEKKHVPVSLAAKHAIADRLVFSKWREGVGGRLRFFVSGGAPLSKKLAYAFWAAGIPILQGYGMTEACLVCANRPDDNKVGSIGKPFEGIEMKIDEKTGEILIRGDNVMLGYYNKPEETAKVIDEEGWYHSGDVGYMDEDGHFYVTDRLKDLFKLSNGKYVAPLQIESLLKQSPLVSQVVVVGSGRKQVGALIVPDWIALRQALEEKGFDTKNLTNEELCEDPHAIKLVQNDAYELTKELAEYERVKRVYLLPREFSIDKGEITPTLKVKRSVIDEKYAEAIDEICGTA